MTPEQKLWVDNASYQEIMDKIRAEPPDSEWFQEKLGAYVFDALMRQVNSLCSQDTVSVARWDADFEAKSPEN